ncbi:hypothetical protein HDV01_002400 [Terramyces sp. JEL0728]|nr:hypothetical protein HDV01_002400 [Terramyces sp. JEL0728]
MLNQLPPDVLENRIFYYLSGQDLYSLSQLNEQMRDRFSPITVLEKFGLKPNHIWPRLALDFKGEFQKKFQLEEDYAIDPFELAQELLLELASIKWYFPQIYVNSTSFPLLQKYLPNAHHVCVHVIEQDSYDALGNSFLANTVHELFIGAMDTIKEDKIFDILANLGKMTKLKKITLSYELEPKIALALQKYLPGSFIEDLDLENNCMDDEFVSILCTALPDTRIKSLSLHWNMVGDEGVVALAEVLPRTLIENLELGRNQIGREGIRALAQALPLCNIKDLSLTENDMAPEDMDEIFDVIHLSKLEKFFFLDNVSENGVKVLAKNLANSKLKHLTLEIPPELLAEFLKEAANSQLEELGIMGERGDEICDILGENISHVTVKVLNLGHGGITATGFEKFISKLPQSDLESLVISDNPIADQGLKLLGTYLPQTRIKKLMLNRCRFGDEGVLALAKCLKETKLELLEMRCYETTGPAVLEVLNSLGKSMRYLDISWSNTIDRDAAARLAAQYPQMTIRY